MEDYLLFADESKPTEHIPYFCFAGISIERNYYENDLIREVNTLKIKYFKKTDVIFHFTDMKKNKREFSIFQDSTIRDNFWKDYVSLISKIPMDIIGVYFSDKIMSDLYKGNNHSNYDIGFYSLLDNYTHYLKSKNILGQICIESRTFKENSYLQKTYYEYLNNGSIYFSKYDTSKYLTSLGFTIKEDNCVGLQIADIVPSQLIRYAEGYKKDFYGLSKTLSSKIYKHDTSYEKILGVKKLC